MRQQIVIRGAAVSDAARIQRLNRDALGYDYPVDKTALRLAELIENPDCRVFVALADDLVVGYVQANGYRATYGDPAVNVMGLAVDESVRGEGVGRALMEYVEAWGRDGHADEVRHNSEAQRVGAHEFYRSIGYALNKMQARFGKPLR